MEEQHIVLEGHRDWALRRSGKKNVNLLFFGVFVIFVGLILFLYGGIILIIIGILMIYFAIRKNKNIEGEREERRRAPLTRISYD